MNRIFLIGFLLTASMAYSQEKETIVISKNNTHLFQGSSQEVSNWYLYMDGDKTWYLANVKISAAEAKDWFEKRKDSDNIFKGLMANGAYATITFSKENDPETLLQFYVKFEREDNKIRSIILTSIDDGNNYVFDHK